MEPCHLGCQSLQGKEFFFEKLCVLVSQKETISPKKVKKYVVHITEFIIIYEIILYSLSK
jgi:hypothetical protein